MFCFPAARGGASETSQVLSRLFTFILWSRLTFAILYPSSCNILQNIHVSLLLWFLFMHRREHSQSQYVKFPYVYVDYLSKNLLAFAGPARAAPACYFLVNPPSLIPSFLPFVASIFATPSNTNRRDVISSLTEREKGVSRELKLFRE